MSIIPRSCITDEEVLPNCQKLIAANGTEIDVDGEAIVVITFTLESRSVRSFLCRVTWTN